MLIKGIICELVTLLSVVAVDSTEVLRPRGVPLSKKAFYDPGKDFGCLDGSGLVPFIQVNDDFCDCDDGSDEPGTNACPDGIFHCPNIGYVQSNIPSSRVNDNYCDCCDGSDEYNTTADCVNNCFELGQHAREEAKRMEELLEKGVEVSQQYVKDAKQRKGESETQIESLKKEMEEVESLKKEKEALKKEAEDREKYVLDQHKAKVDEIKKQNEEVELRKAQEEEAQLAQNAFFSLDVNGDGILSFTELQEFVKFDHNDDGIVTDEEAKFFLHMKDEMELDEFISTGWVIMKPYYLKDESESHDAVSTPADPDSHELPPPPPVSEEYDDNDDDDAEPNTEPAPVDEDEEDELPPVFPPKHPDTEPAPKPVETEYDEETRKLVDEAKAARSAYSEIEGRFLDIQNKIRENEVLLETDYGVDSVFLPLNGQCFEYTDREYTYKFCPFDRASQKPKDGGSEVNLGRWGRWTGTTHKYSEMKLDGGATCWNGPPRSVDVVITCGLTNEVTAASEPSRCEYRFDFHTPAACYSRKEQIQEEDHTHEHIEL